ncbi:hypothetical protein JOD54_004147 [Actinokineospora baliensis]|nr:hypothetical protein [Actinokineospora baliensis]MBM7773943.1 hypothetical protein [Actinokineospora baliensis]
MPLERMGGGVVVSVRDDEVAQSITAAAAGAATLALVGVCATADLT